eukprot:TRINITY_DN5833_c0_g1_i2.p3 TRINITY_DN5833_c0_g1~~TRINITY_DN5833_c0_g1_i2.p3  ORF type:complete len:138 (-),score=34.39 TRINITY_DN5833_c0_g1_i2:114-527(-)
MALGIHYHRNSSTPGPLIFRRFRDEHLENEDGQFFEPVATTKQIKQRKEKMILRTREEGYPFDDPEYPFKIQGEKFPEGEFFEIHYRHRFNDIKCGMDSTMVGIQSNPRPEEEWEPRTENMKQQRDLPPNPWFAGFQ